MSVYIDKAGHLAADSLDELHQFAAKIGLKSEWFQEKGELSHYDCTVHWRRQRAIDMGARLTSIKEMPGLVRAMNRVETS